MDEKTKEKPEDKKPEGTEAGADEGKKYETTPIIERAREEREKLDAANKKKEELLNREEEIMAKKALGGESEAGQEPVKETDDEKKKAGAKEFFAGTQLEKDIDKL